MGRSDRDVHEALGREASGIDEVGPRDSPILVSGRSGAPSSRVMAFPWGGITTRAALGGNNLASC